MLKEELIELRKLGLSMIYMGVESWADKVLRNINKGVAGKNY